MWKREKRRGRHAGGGARTRSFVRKLPALMILGGLVFDAFTPQTFTAIPLFVAAPLIAAPFFSLASTVRTGIASMLAVIALRLYSSTLPQVVPLIELLTLATVSVLAVVINGVVRRGNEQLASARFIAETAMRAVLPQPSDRIGGLQVAARYEAAQADEFVGGDLFAVADSPQGCGWWSGTCGARGSKPWRRWRWSWGRSGRRPSRSPRWRGGRAAGAGAGAGGGAAGRARCVGRLHHRRAGRDPVRALPGAHRQSWSPRTDPAPPGRCAGGAEALGARAAARHGPGGVAGADGRVGSAGRDDTAALHGRAVRGAERRGVFYDPAARLRGRIFPGPEELLSALTDDVRLHTGGETTDDMALLAVVRPAAGQPDRRRTVRIVGAETA